MSCVLTWSHLSEAASRHKCCRVCATAPLDLAHQRNEDFGLLLSRYAIERLLYRLSLSPYGHSFVLKGAQLFSLWMAQPYRSTRDLDLLCEGDPAHPRLAAIFRDVCTQQPDKPDGMRFIANTVRAEVVREDAFYDGVRIHLRYELGSATDVLQVDVGFGDAAVPPPDLVEIASLLDFPAPQLRAYARETVVAEKLETMLTLGIRNSRMKDFSDLYYLAQQFTFAGLLLCAAIQATLTRRSTPIPTDVPLALTPIFAADPVKQTLWSAFIRRTRLGGHLGLEEIITELQRFLLPPLSALANGMEFTRRWTPGVGWQSID